MAERVLRLYPPPATEVGTPYEDLDLPPAGERVSPLPYVVINMVSSVDGRVTTAQGGASRIGSAIDRRVMRVLRSKADAVMIGAGTLRAERLSLGLDGIIAGAQPLGVVVSRGGDVPPESNLISNTGQEIIVLVPEGGPSRAGGRGNRLAVPMTSSGSVDLGRALRLLRSEFAVSVLLVEGGPSLNHALISLDLADELCLTISPKLLGGTSNLSVLEGPALAPRETRLLAAHLAGDELFLRYAVGRR